MIQIGKQQRGKLKARNGHARPDPDCWNPRLKQHGPKITRELKEMFGIDDDPDRIWYAAALPGDCDERWPERMEEETWKGQSDCT